MWGTLDYIGLEFKNVPLLEYKRPHIVNFWPDYFFETNIDSSLDLDFNSFCNIYCLDNISDNHKALLKEIFNFSLSQISWNTFPFDEVKSYFENSFCSSWFNDDFSVYLDLLKEYFDEKVLIKYPNNKRNIAFAIWNIKASIAMIIDDYNFWLVPLKYRPDEEKTVL